MSENASRNGLRKPGSKTERFPWIRFDRNELAGSFGDLGTDIPLILAMIPAAGLDAASVLVMFGLLQVATGVLYGLPMPVQPLKAMAVLVITHRLSGAVLHGAGLAIGLIMFALAASGMLDWLARHIPRSVVRGVQLGLGLSLARLALSEYVPYMGWVGYGLAAAGFAVTVCLWQNRRVPAALVLIVLGLTYAALTREDSVGFTNHVGLAFPKLRLPAFSEIWTGFLLLALPQLPLSISNAVIATEQTVRDLYPYRHVNVRKIGLTYAAMNAVASLFQGVPVCHGCGGLAGHYAFGARTGGSVIIYGTFYLLVGLFFSGVAEPLLRAFPLPILGVVLFFESLVLMRFIEEVAGSRRSLSVALMVGAFAFALPYGFVVAPVVGTLVEHLSRRFGWLSEPPVPHR